MQENAGWFSPLLKTFFQVCNCGDSLAGTYLTFVAIDAQVKASGGPLIITVTPKMGEA